MAIAGFLARICLALLASGLWLRCATLQNCPPPWRNPRKGRDQILPSGILDKVDPFTMGYEAEVIKLMKEWRDERSEEDKGQTSFLCSVLLPPGAGSLNVLIP